MFNLIPVLIGFVLGIVDFQLNRIYGFSMWKFGIVEFLVAYPLLIWFTVAEYREEMGRWYL